MTSAAIALLISHRTHPGRRDDVRAVWERLTAHAGHLAYVYCLDEDDADRITAFQVYADDTAATAFLRTGAYRAYEAEVAALLLGPPEVRRLRPTWTKLPG